MPDLSLVTLDFYKSHQYTQLREEYRGLIDVGLDLNHFLEAARLKLGCTPDDARLAYQEARGDI